MEFGSLGAADIGKHIGVGFVEIFKISSTQDSFFCGREASDNGLSNTFTHHLLCMVSTFICTNYVYNSLSSVTLSL